MGWYRCVMTGENFPGVLLDRADPIGFQAICFVEAESEGAAEQSALQLLRSDARLTLPAGVHYTLQAKVYLHEVEPVPEGVVPRGVPELYFFDMAAMRNPNRRP